MEQSNLQEILRWVVFGYTESTDQSLHGEVSGSQNVLPFVLVKTFGRWSSTSSLVVLCQLVFVELGELGLHDPAQGCRKASRLEA